MAPPRHDLANVKQTFSFIPLRDRNARWLSQAARERSGYGAAASEHASGSRMKSVDAAASGDDDDGDDDCVVDLNLKKESLTVTE